MPGDVVLCGVSCEHTPNARREFLLLTSGQSGGIGTVSIIIASIQRTSFTTHVK